jgi:hypothetical protein
MWVWIAPPFFQQTFIGGIADQRVLEEIGRLRRQTAAVDQFRLYQTIQRDGPEQRAYRVFCLCFHRYRSDRSIGFWQGSAAED